MTDRGSLPWKAVIPCLVVALCLLLPRLGERAYWGDEREDFNFVYRILERGLPDMSGGAHTDGGPQVNDRGWHVYHPWAPLYQMALSVKLFGWEARGAVRAWGVLWALLSIPVLWRLARRLGQSGAWASWLYVLSPFMLVPARSSRYYGAVLLFGTLLLLDYWKTRDGERWAPWRLGLWMALLFHHNTMSAAALGVGLAVHWGITGRPAFKAFLTSVLVCAVPVGGWLVWAGALGQGGVLDVSLIPSRGVKTIWLLLASTLPGPLLLVLIRRRRDFREALIFFACLLGPLCLLISASSHVTPNMRYLLPWLPLGCLAGGLWLETLTRRPAFIVFILLVGSNLMQLIPLGLVNLVPAEKLAAYGRGAGDAERFVRATAQPRFLLTGHLAELMTPYEGPGDTLRELLREAGYQAGQTIALLVPENADGALRRHTLTSATFDLNGGLPGEMLEAVFVATDRADWVVAFDDGFEPGPGFSPAGTGDNTLGFWIEGPNPFNRRWTTTRGGVVRIWRRVAGPIRGP